MLTDHVKAMQKGGARNRQGGHVELPSPASTAQTWLQEIGRKKKGEGKKRR